MHTILFCIYCFSRETSILSCIYPFSRVGKILSQGDLPNPGIEPGSPALQADSLPAEPPGNHIILSSVQSLHRVRLFVTPWTAARQASLSITNSRCLFKLLSIESVMPSNRLCLCCPLLLLPSIFPSIRESVLQ